ncbi:hypothetical protein RvY_19299 [Ramazzottius varieornatus]|uniref:Lebercilin domain-containing protein n=1 Tax=Ramazzottius varieornatus TaxID=947166 RepID=A0A1D1W8Y2_RAMVA|nr:hypothetical protein RvY_19299 [Ramazzottius varieornatus]
MNGHDHGRYDEDFDESLQMMPPDPPTNLTAAKRRPPQPTIAELQHRLNQTYVTGNHFRKSVSGTVVNGRTSATFSNSDKKSSASTFNSSIRLPTISSAYGRNFTKIMSRSSTNQVAEKILSAKAKRVGDLENERNLLRTQVENLKREVRTLNQMYRVQGKALGQYEGDGDRFPSLLQKSEEDGRITREHLRQARHKYAQLREQHRALESTLQSVEKERDQLRGIANDQDLFSGKTLKEERDAMTKQVCELEDKLQESEKRVASLQKSQKRERQFSDSRLKDLNTKYEELLAENTELKANLKRIETRPGHHARARSQGPSSAVSSAAPSRKPSVVTNQALSSNFTKPETHSEVNINAKPSFIRQFHDVTSTDVADREAYNTSENTKKRASVVVVADVESVAEKYLNARQTRTSPDLLRDHDERVLSEDRPSASPNTESPPNDQEVYPANSKPADDEQASKKTVLKNSLLDKIRSLNVEKQARGSGYSTNDDQISDKIPNTTSRGNSLSQTVLSDDEIEEVEVFNS